MKFAGSLVLVLVATSVFTTGGKHRKSPPPSPSPPPPSPPPPPPSPSPPPPLLPPGTHKPKTVVVGESELWHYGFDYTSWAKNYARSNPFFFGDSLVFNYTAAHNVVLLPDFPSYLSCNATNAKLLGDTSAGAKGVQVKLTAKNPNVVSVFYFACSQANGAHCNANGGKMKFLVAALPRP